MQAGKDVIDRDLDLLGIRNWKDHDWLWKWQ